MCLRQGLLLELDVSAIITVDSGKLEVNLTGSKVGINEIDVDSNESEVNVDPGEVEVPVLVAVDELEADSSIELESEFEETGTVFLVTNLDEIAVVEFHCRGAAAIPASLGDL